MWRVNVARECDLSMAAEGVPRNHKCWCKRCKQLMSSDAAFAMLFILCKLLIIDLMLYKTLSVILSLLSSNTTSLNKNQIFDFY